MLVIEDEYPFTWMELVVLAAYSAHFLQRQGSANEKQILPLLSAES